MRVSDYNLKHLASLPEGATVVSLYIYGTGRLQFKSIPKAGKVANVMFSMTNGPAYMAGAAEGVSNSRKFELAKYSVTRSGVEKPDEISIREFQEFIMDPNPIDEDGTNKIKF